MEGGLRSVLHNGDEFDLQLGNVYGHGKYDNYYSYRENGCLYNGEANGERDINWGRKTEKYGIVEYGLTSVQIFPYLTGPPIMFKRLVLPEGIKELIIGSNTVVEDPVRLPHGIRAVKIPSNVQISNLDEFKGKSNIKIEIAAVNNRVQVNWTNTGIR